jgi:hypothetical protein
LTPNGRLEKRTLLSPSHLITIYEYTPLATYHAACQRWPGIPITLRMVRE